MKSLYLLRHAKSGWGSIDLDDHDRTLSERGNEDAPKLAAAISERRYVPDLIACSSARRTRQTLAHLQAVIGVDIPVTIQRELYLASDQTILRLIRKTKDDQDSLLVLGHNPGMEDLANRLCGPASEKTPRFPTAALAAFEFDVDHWREVETGTGRLIGFMTPKSLAAQT